MRKLQYNRKFFLGDSKISSKHVIKYVMAFGLSLGFLSSVAHAEIYKITKADGSVVYSDRVSNINSNKTEVVNIPSYTSSVPSNNSSNRTNVSQKTSENKRAINYSIEIVSPAKERAYRKPVQNIDVKVKVSPSLRAEDRVVILLDGNQVGTGKSVSIPTLDLNPGEHTLEAKVIGAGDSSSNTPSMRVYVIHNTNALQRKRQLQNQINAYNRLPWYKKLAIKKSN